jgi:hypothetical protein
MFVYATIPAYGLIVLKVTIDLNRVVGTTLLINRTFNDIIHGKEAGPIEVLTGNKGVVFPLNRKNKRLLGFMLGSQYAKDKSDHVLFDMPHTSSIDIPLVGGGEEIELMFAINKSWINAIVTMGHEKKDVNFAWVQYYQMVEHLGVLVCDPSQLFLASEREE